MIPESGPSLNGEILDCVKSESSPAEPTPLPLLPQHLEDFKRSGLSDEMILRCQFRSTTDPTLIAKNLNISRKVAKCLGPCLAFPFFGLDDTYRDWCRYKPDNPWTDADGDTAKYVSRKKRSDRDVSVMVFFVPGTGPKLTDVSVPLIITEGEKKIAKAVQEGFTGVGLTGVECWSAPRKQGANGRKVGPRELHPDLVLLPWIGREVWIIFDSDAFEKPEVQRAEQALAKALRAVKAKPKIIRLPPGPIGEKVGLDDFLVAHGPEALRQLIEGPPLDRPDEVTAAAGGDGEKCQKRRGGGAADVLVDIGLAAELWHDSTSTAYATIGRQSLKIMSKRFRQYLIREYRKREEKQVPNGVAITNALAVIEATAIHDGKEHKAYTRVAGFEGKTYLHLGDSATTVIEVDRAGWGVCPAPPVRFVRPAGMAALPIPVAGGDLANLRHFLNLPDDSAFSLFLACLTSALQPEGPYPALVLLGEQGSAKTTTSRLFKKLIDPQAAMDRCEPKEVRDLMIRARHEWAIALDNLSSLPIWLSDALCRLATGGGFATRRLYTDDEEETFDAKRPTILNGIEDFIARADLLERSVLLRHPPISEKRRRLESELNAEFEVARPALLGALLTRVSGGLRCLSEVMLDQLPRMADFARFAVACEQGAGEKETVFAAYKENQSSAHEQALEASLLPVVLLKLMENHPNGWEGSATDLLDALTQTAFPGQSAEKPTPPFPPKDWPKKPNHLTGKLRRLAPNLRRVHRLDVDCDFRDPSIKRSRKVKITRLAEPGNCRDSSSASSRSSEPQETPGKSTIHPNGSTDDSPSDPTSRPSTNGELRRRQTFPDDALVGQVRVVPSGKTLENEGGSSSPDVPDDADDESRPLTETNRVERW